MGTAYSASNDNGGASTAEDGGEDGGDIGGTASGTSVTQTFVDSSGNLLREAPDLSRYPPLDIFKSFGGRKGTC